jgi:hypothetical protein
VDGVPSKPVSARAEFIKIALTGLQVVEVDAKPLDVSTAIIGVILSYPVKRLPKHVSIDWELFNKRIDRIPSMAIDPAGPLSSFITSSEPKIEWQNFLKKYEEPKVVPISYDDGRSIPVPLLSLALLVVCLGSGLFVLSSRGLPRRGWAALAVSAGVAATLLIRVAVIELDNPLSGPPEKETAAQIVKRILINVDNAFVEREPAPLRRALAVVVDKDRFRDVKAELDRALAIKVPGGGIARIEDIHNLVIKNVSSIRGVSGFRTLATWTARASGGHWGHAHRRTIHFEALMEITEAKGIWKLSGLTVIAARRES